MDFSVGYLIPHCETNWMDSYVDPMHFGNVVHSCSRHLRFGRMGIPLMPFRGFHLPPTEEQYRLAIDVTKNFHEQISRPAFDIVEILGEDHPLLTTLRATRQEFAGDDQGIHHTAEIDLRAQTINAGNGFTSAVAFH